MSASAHWPGLPVVGENIPPWVTEVLRRRGKRSAGRIADPRQDEGWTVPEALKLGFSWTVLCRWAKPKPKGQGISWLGGEVLKTWYDYQTRGERVLRVRVFSAEQLRRTLAARSRVADARREASWLAYAGVVERYPDLFLSDIRPRPQAKRRAADGWRLIARNTLMVAWRVRCPYLPDGRPINHRREHGRWYYDPVDVDQVAQALRAERQGVWTDPATSRVYFTTERAMRGTGINRQTLWLHTRKPSVYLDGDTFHPIPRPRAGRGMGGIALMWPKDEIDHYLKGRAAAPQRLGTAARWITDVIVKEGPLLADYGMRRFRAAWPSRSRAFWERVRRRAGIECTRIGPGRVVWHLAGQLPPNIRALLPQLVAAARADQPRQRHAGGRPRDAAAEHKREVCYRVFVSGVTMAVGRRQVSKELNARDPLEWAYIRTLAKRHNPDAVARRQENMARLATGQKH
jgi:hypothetical protein